MTGAKPFDIPKREVWEAFKHVKANQGAAGVDGQSIEDFEGRLAANLYKLWNRLSSGSYMPPPVRRVDIPKASGGTRPLGIPTVADRVAQEVVRRYLEPLLEPAVPRGLLWVSSRPIGDRCDPDGAPAVLALDWVLDIDIKGFFDSIDHELLLRAVRKHTECAWVLLYIERWLKAPAMLEGGELVARERGTPQGGVISPLLANLFLHYAFDSWMGRAVPGVAFERYADDIICHCRSEREARELWRAVDRAVRRVRAGAPPAEDQVGLLQGHQPARRARLHQLRLPRLHVPAAAGEVAGRALRGLVPAGGEPHGSEGHPAARCATGGFRGAATRGCSTSHGCSIHTSAAGSATTVTSTSRRSIRPSSDRRPSSSGG